MKPLVLLLLICLSGIAAVPVTVVADGDYMGGGIQIGGSGTKVTRVTTAAATVTTTAALPLATLPTVGSLTVATSPAGATLFIDGVQRGISPATIPSLAQGGHTLKVTMDGYVDLMAPVTVTAGQTNAYTFDLSPLAAAENANPAATKKKTPGFEAFLGIAALGAMVLVTKTCR
jgi:hypothetical protein